MVTVVVGVGPTIDVLPKSSLEVIGLPCARLGMERRKIRSSWQYMMAMLKNS